MPRRTVAFALPSLTLTLAALAQANYSESFTGVGDGSPSTGGPSLLTSRGWTFRNQSRDVGISPYWTGSPWGESGACLGHGAFSQWQNSQSKLSAWILLPAIPSQQAGDPIRFATSAWTNAFGDNNGLLELRYSPTGGTSTGSGADAVGSFTQVLLTIPGDGGHDWTQRTATLPGAGRVALRLVMNPQPSAADFTTTFYIDSLQIGNPPPPPYPMPAPGQSVHWTTAHSPVTLANNGSGQPPTIPAGATVIVDPGVEVRIPSGVRLNVAGTMSVQATTAAPALFRGQGAVVVQKNGLLTAQHADVQTFTDLVYGGRASFTDSTFTDPTNPTTFSYSGPGDIGHRVFDGNLDYARQILTLERCTFGQGCSVSILRGWLAARDCTFTKGQVVTTTPGANGAGGEAVFVVGNSILNNVTVTDGFVSLQQNHDQHRYVGNITVTGNPAGPGLSLAGGGNYLIDQSVTLSGHQRPVAFGVQSAGILPGSRLPATGNQLNEILDTDDAAPLDEKTIWADAGIPYVASSIGTSHGQITILPGVTVKIPADVAFFFDTDSNGAAMPVFLGEPGSPVRFVPQHAGEQWTSIAIGNTRWYGTRWDWCEIEGSRFGAGAAECPIAFDNCTFRDNQRAVGGSSAYAFRKCTFENNIYSYSGERFAPLHEIDGFLNANHPANPNSFINNNGTPGDDFFNSFLPHGGLLASARHNSLESTDSDVRNNWWGTPTGPHHPTLNPTGQGDDVYFGTDAGGFLLPFLTQPPTTNPPPVVRFVTRPIAAAEPGLPLHISWTARDDGAITTQRIYFSPDTNLDSAMQLLAEIPASARSFEFTPPSIGTPPNGADQFLRVVAVDDRGQEGIADLPFKISNPAALGGSISPTPITGVHAPGDSIPVCFTATPPVAAVNVALELDNDDTGVSLGGIYPTSGSNCLPLNLQTPDVSTDRARLRYDFNGSLNQVRSTYGPYFSIRPDAMLGDAAPAIALTSAHAGATYPADSTVHLTWNASDDEALRGFDVRVSLDGGTRWHVVARDLPADARAYDWHIPASSGVQNARLRVVAKDKRFQNTSAESASFSIAAGAWHSTPACAADLGSAGGVAAPDGTLDNNDFIAFINHFFNTDARADLGAAGGLPGRDGAFDNNDFIAFINRFFAGCG